MKRVLYTLWPFFVGAGFFFAIYLYLGQELDVTTRFFTTFLICGFLGMGVSMLGMVVYYVCLRWKEYEEKP